MPLRVLELGRFSLASTATALMLEAVFRADLACPTSIADLDDDALVTAVTSRQLWVSRGRGCRVDIELLLDGKTLDKDVHSQLLQSLGCQIRDAKQWAQLCLSASPECLSDVPSFRVPQLSIHLNNSTKPSDHEEDLAAWIGNIDVNPPSGVVCAQFERLHVSFNFVPIRDSKVVNVPAPSPLIRPQSPDIMLLDLPIDDTVPMALQQAGTHRLEQAVESLKGLPGQVASCFSLPDPTMFDLKLLPNAPSLTSGPRTNLDEVSVSVSAPDESARGKTKSKRIPEKARQILDAWVEAHGDNLYPSREEKEKLMSATGLKKGQLQSQLSCYRQRLKRKLGSNVKAGSGEEKLLDDLCGDEVSEAGWYDESLLLDDVDFGATKETSDDDMLLSQSPNETTPPLSQSSTISTATSTDSTIFLTDSNSLVETGCSWDSPVPTNMTTISFADFAFRTLMGANLGRQLRIPGLQLRSRPHVTMSSFVPSMFTPGFKNTIASHSRFLPTISHALCASMPRNLQTPSLRRKLLQISNLKLPHSSDSDDQLGKPGTAQRLAAVVQTRLWGMMQRKLFEKAAGKRLWRTTTQGDKDEESHFEDMLATGEDGKNLILDEIDGMSDEEILFADDEDDDLLLGNDEYQFDEDWERRAIENETEDMLPGGEWHQKWAETHEEMLLGDSSIYIETIKGNGNILCLQGSDDEMLLDESDNDVLELVDETCILLLGETGNEDMLI